MFNAQQFENMDGNKLTDFFKPAAKTVSTSEDSPASSAGPSGVASTGVNFKKRKSSDNLENTPKKKAISSPVKGGIAAFLTKSPQKPLTSKFKENVSPPKAVSSPAKTGIAAFFTKKQKKPTSSSVIIDDSSLKTKEDKDLERALKLSMAEMTNSSVKSHDLEIIDEQPGPSNRSNTTPVTTPELNHIPKADTSWVGEFDLSLLDEIPKHRKSKAYKSLRTIPCNMCFQPVSLCDFKQHIKQHLIENHIL